MNTLRTMSQAFRVLIAPLGLALLVSGLAAPASADPRDDLAQAEREAAEAAAVLENATEQAQDAARRYAVASAELPSARARLDEARGKVAAVRVAANAAIEAAEIAEADLAAATGRFEDSAAEVDRARGQVDAFVVAAYKGSGAAAFNMLLASRDPAEVAERFGYLDHVVSAEQAAVADLTSTRLHARQAENEALVAQREAERARRAAADAVARAGAAEAEATTVAAEAEQVAQDREAALAAAEAEREESLRRYDDAEAQAARLEVELREWEAAQQAAAGGPGSATGGRGSGAMFLTPTEGWQSSPFGMRSDPFFQVWQMHGGVDIAAPGGAPIRAAADATVIRAGWSGGYGLLTCLSHGTYRGQGLSTCYAHQSEILVSPGEQVGRGDLIGRVGTTGASTGTHLHFEVRLDGAPTDPMGYLPSCLC